MPASGSIEVGHIHFSDALKQHPAATAAMFLMADHVFSLGYRRYEWKCDALNAASCRAAERLGFTFEGIFRQATVYRSRNRDTAWYSIVDGEWPTLKKAYEAWMSSENFDSHGKQKRSLVEFRAAR
jgi:RimJ/RimL family protein N-acetyltransferase